MKNVTSTPDYRTSLGLFPYICLTYFESMGCSFAYLHLNKLQPPINLHTVASERLFLDNEAT